MFFGVEERGTNSTGVGETHIIPEKPKQAFYWVLEGILGIIDIA